MTTTMAYLLASNKCVLLSLSVVVVLCLGGGASAMGSLPPPPPMVNFSIGVQGVVWCNTCRYPGYFAPMDASPAGRRGMPLKFQEFVKRDNGLQGMYSVGNRLFRPKNPAKC
ncbi:hypothetical protein ZEAMMB73_Zm00001d038740 [Zea mays]|uniref:Uncharacterized protein n=1 Tax=Zea mays TaxID=4577 RepID=A0A1D6MA70_MAIZE|nr:hypothetical protein ZEAMMB73_Zm00001d038740 [Zea mays]